MKYAIYGAGSLGIVLGAYLTKAGVDIELVNRNKQHVDALLSKGARVKGKANFKVPVKAIFPNEMEGKYDVIFLMTKQLYNDKVVKDLNQFLADDGVIVTLQNGIPEPGIAEIIGSNRTIGCVVEWGATLSAPGESTLTSEPDSLSFQMGAMEGVPEARVQEVKELLEKMCPVNVEENLLSVRWSKLLINATFSGLGTVMGGTFGDVVNDQFARKVALRCMKECIDVGRAEGVRFAPVQGKDITKIFYYTNGLKKSIALKAIPKAMEKHMALVPSMLQDLRNGKKCEIEAINGVVCEYGKKNNIPTPVNDKIVDIVKKEQDGSLPFTKENIMLFDTIMMQKD